MVGPREGPLNNQRGGRDSDLGGRVFPADTTGHYGAVDAAAALSLHGGVEHQFQNVLSSKRPKRERERICVIDEASASRRRACR